MAQVTYLALLIEHEEGLIQRDQSRTRPPRDSESPHTEIIVRSGERRRLSC